MLNMGEIVVVNSAGALILFVAIMTRLKAKIERHASGRIMDVMYALALIALLFETASFAMDGKGGKGVNFLQYVFNGYLFLASCMMGALWVLYVDARIFHSAKRLKNWGIVLSVAYSVIIALIICDFCGVGLIFSIAPNNVYSRGKFVGITYVFILACYIASIVLAIVAIKLGNHFRFFPIHCFILPCLIGTIVQYFFYGIAIGWFCISIALMFVQVQRANHNSFIDYLSGMYNRNYYQIIMNKLAKSRRNRFVGGVMLDIDGFKQINDEFGHSVGDEAIKTLGLVLANVSDKDTLAFRVGGDEFIVLHVGGNIKDVYAVKDEIEETLKRFNDMNDTPYSLRLSIGVYTCMTADTNPDDFHCRLDKKMYEQKALRKTIDA